VNLTESKIKLDVKKIQLDFPILQQNVRNGNKLVYLDSAATSQKPKVVIDAVSNYYEKINSGVHRGAHYLAELATDAYEDSRQAIAGFVNVKADQIIFTKNATESINLLAYGLLNATLQAKFDKTLDPRLIISENDEILITELEHHSNIVPWQELCLKTGAQLKWIPLNADGSLDYSSLEKLVSKKTKVISVTHMSNVLGTLTDIELITKYAKSVNALLFIDACQSVPQMPVDFQNLGADAIAWSGHKMLGPLGIGLFAATTELLDILPPFLTGGSMIETVTMEKTTFAKAPKKFEAGTPAAAEAVGLAQGVAYLNKIGMINVFQHEKDLANKMVQGLLEIPGVTVFGPHDGNRGGAVSFALQGLHPHDVGQVLDDLGIAVRVGHHCAKPAMKKLNVQSTTRASTYIYNDESDVDIFLDGVTKVFEFFGSK